MNNKFRQRLIEERADLPMNIYSLECSDDMLFTDGSGNLGIYKSMVARIRTIDELLEGASHEETIRKS